MKICIFMSDNRPLSPIIEEAQYNSLTAVINNEYCKKYNYDFIYYKPFLKDKKEIKLFNCIDPNTNETRHAAWSKLLSSSLVLNLEYDYIVYIDSDCIFKRFDISLEEIIKPNCDKNIIFYSDKPHDFKKPNSGFYICKVCPSTKNFIKEWYNYNIPEKNREHPWEQCALWKIYEKEKIHIINDWTMFEVYGQFLRHITHFEDYKQKRMLYFSNVIKSNNFDYKENINNIKSISYDTNNFYENV